MYRLIICTVLYRCIDDNNLSVNTHVRSEMYREFYHAYIGAKLLSFTEAKDRFTNMFTYTF